MARLIRIARRAEAAHSKTINRVGGEPVGMTKASWPLCKGRPMHHVVTLERAAIVHDLPPGIAAVAVFVSAIGANQAYSPSTDETKVVFLTNDDLARGETPARALFGSLEGYEPAESAALVFEETSYVFEEARNPDRREDGPEEALDEEQVSWAISGFMAGRRSGSIQEAEVHGLSATHVEWCQSPEAPDGHRVLFWFYEALVPGLNCGDGIMYVTSSPDATEAAAWWQC